MTGSSHDDSLEDADKFADASTFNYAALLDHYIKDNESRAKFIERLHGEIVNKDTTAKTTRLLQLQQTTLTDKWLDFTDTHDRLTALIPKVADHSSRAYITDGRYYTVALLHDEVKEAMLVLLDERKVKEAELKERFTLDNSDIIPETKDSPKQTTPTATKAPTAPMASADPASSIPTAAACDHHFQAASLGKLEIESFDGDPLKWKPFSELFTAVYINNPRLSDAIRLMYLLSKVTGEAKRILHNVSITAANFKPSWKKLVDRYEDTRLLTTAHCDKLFGPPYTGKDPLTAAQIYKLSEDITEHSEALKTLGIPVEHWDVAIIVNAVKRLDGRLVREWELFLGHETPIPTLSQFQHFLYDHARAAERSGGISKAIRSTEQPPKADYKGKAKSGSAKVHVSTAQSNNGNGNSNQQGNSQPRGTPAGAPRQACPLCGVSHSLTQCSTFRMMSKAERRSFVTTKRLCFFCFLPHSVSVCTYKTRCRDCGQGHHTWICHSSNKPQQPHQTTAPVQSGQWYNGTHGATPASQPSMAQVLQQQPSSCAAQTTTDELLQDYKSLSAASPGTRALLATSLAYLIDDNGHPHKVRLLLDTASEVSLISEELTRRLHLQPSRSTLGISGVGGNSSGPTKGTVNVTLKSCYNDYKVQCVAHTLKTITADIPSVTTNQRSWAHLDGLQLADPNFLVPAPIDILVGADVFGQLLKSGVVKAKTAAPVAINSHFGWVVLGNFSHAEERPPQTLHVTSSEASLEEILIGFWKQEEVPTGTKAKVSQDEESCEQHFVRTHSRDAEGRYIVRIPLTGDPSTLGGSYNRALSCLQRTLRRVDSDSRYGKLYTEFLREYKDLGHMRQLSTSDIIPRNTYYLPHHGVLRESSETTKLRVVFDASAKTSTGVSLNGISHTGQNLQRNLTDVLMWTRRHKYIFMTDITKMFRQIKVHPDDWHLQSILWPDDSGKVVTHQLTTVTYGTRSAPFLSQRVMQQLVQDEGHRFPLAVEPMLKGRYVDDISGGAPTTGELLEVAKQVTDLCAAGAMPLAKWHSNSEDFLNSLNEDTASTAPRVFEDDSTKILGLSWYPRDDNFVFSLHLDTNAPVTKRQIASEIARLYDPLGFVSPVVVKAKLTLQDLWKAKTDWDEPVTPDVRYKWNLYRESLRQLTELKIPRHYGMDNSTSVEIHGFSDASQAAKAAVVYLRIKTPGEEPRITLVISKTKVVPPKEQVTKTDRPTIPRLELEAAVLLSRLVVYVQHQLDLKDAPVHLWSDSTATLGWIAGHPSRWKEFVRNRVAFIQETTPTAKWRYISGKINPADCASRGMTPKQLAAHGLWWRGPRWLAQDQSQWPSLEAPEDPSIALEEKPGFTFVTRPQSQIPWRLLEYCSDLDKLLNLTAIWQRFIQVLQKVPGASIRATPLNDSDMERARQFWIKTTQAAHLNNEIRAKLKDEQFPRSHFMSRLTAHVDGNGILRVGGRLENANRPEESKHPAILPRDSLFTQLVIRDAHERTIHGGTQVTLSYVRQRYWIIGGRVPVGSFIRKCVTCTRFRGERAQQLMGQLPAYRLAQVRPFLLTGVDYAGPVWVKTWKGRGHKKYKAWLVIFVCMVTGAVHVDLVSDYSAEGFVATFRRFTSRRGICKTLYSDCGTNLVGADGILKEMFTEGTESAQRLSQLLLKDGTEWKFNPPSAPHFGGKWEAGVKSVKYHLARAIGDTLLTFEELSTLLAQVEAVLNSRPLEPMSEDPDDLAVLTPGHFLTGDAINAIPEGSYEHINVSRLSRWQLIQHRLQYFWTRWTNSYLNKMQSISKWHYPSRAIKVGSMVLLADDDKTPPTKWPLARVIEVHPGQDGLVRVVTIKTATTTLKRPIAKLVLLPIDVPDTSVTPPPTASLTRALSTGGVYSETGI